MPRKSRGSTRSAKTARRRESAKRARRAAETAAADDEASIDGCDIDFTQGVLTEDADLPPTRGGVAIVPAPQRRAVRRR